MIANVIVCVHVCDHVCDHVLRARVRSSPVWAADIASLMIVYGLSCSHCLVIFELTHVLFLVLMMLIR